MIQFFGISIDALTNILLFITAIIVGVVLLLALGNVIFFKIGVRNISRRRMQMVLIIFALMLSTTLLSSVLATGDVMTSAVQSVAVYNWGNIDELIEGGQGSLDTYPDAVYYSLLDHSKQDSTDIVAVGAALHEVNLLVADETSRQVRSKVSALAILPTSEQGFGGMQDVNTKRHLTIKALPVDQVYLNQTAAQNLNARSGDLLYLYSQRWPGQRHALRVAGVVGNNGLVGDSPEILCQLQTFQDFEGAQDQINQVFIANRTGGGISSADLSNQVTAQLQAWLQSLQDSVRPSHPHNTTASLASANQRNLYVARQFASSAQGQQVLTGHAARLTPYNLHINQVKQDGVQTSLKAGEIFSRIFSLFALFALAIGLLLIFLIFVLLAAERRAEMGMARAIGVQRHHLILMFLFEGSVYDVISACIGLLFGVLAGFLLIYFLGPVLARFNFPLKFQFQPHSLIVAYCLGVIFTFFSVALSSWLVSRMTIVEALRDQPEPGSNALSLGELGVRCLQLGRELMASFVSPGRYLRRLRRILFEHIPDLLVSVVRELTRLGFLPFLVGSWLMQYGLESAQVIPFSLGLSLLLIGGGLLLKVLFLLLVPLILRIVNREYDLRRWNKVVDGVFAALMGTAIAAYWALPFDVLAGLGLPRFQGGIEVFFIAGVMMVLGVIWAIIANARVLASPWLAFWARFASFYALVKLASVYPLQRRFRTSLSIIMFSLVVFAMTVMAVITNSMQNTYVDINTQTGGYDIQGTAYFKSLPDLRSSLVQHGINPTDFSAIGVRSTTAVGVIQLSANTPRWSLYPAQVVSGGFLQGYGLNLTARANGFASDNAIWQALQTHPDYALIDSSALPYNPNAASDSSVYDPSAPQGAGAPATPPGFDQNYTFALDGVYQGDKSFPATSIWVTGTQAHAVTKLTIIGVVDNSDSAHFGLYISRSAYSNAGLGSGEDPNNPQSESYYFKVAPGQDKRALTLALGSAYLDYGLETTVLEDAIWQTRGPRILLSDILLGIVGMTLLLGVAALAITGTRAVLERRQQIGMMRALGCSRLLVQGAFLLESFLVGIVGSALGIVLGLILARNIFAANFFEQYQTGLFFSIPWQQLEIIVGVSFLAALLGAILPAWQAGKISPAEALRYS